LHRLREDRYSGFRPGVRASVFQNRTHCCIEGVPAPMMLDILNREIAKLNDRGISWFDPGFSFMNDRVQENYSRARFNANANRRVAYRHASADYCAECLTQSSDHSLVNHFPDGCRNKSASGKCKCRDW